MTKEELDSVSEKIIGAAYKISNTLGSGFLEKVYENALAHELRKDGMKIEQQKSIKVYYDNMVVGDYFADLIVDETIIVELKTAKHIDNIHLAQTLNYLKATGLKLGLIINFGKPRVEIKRVANSLCS
ncbi:MAG: GxxExxY protein [Spirochaetales bacterium]|nr:GxxExxY protein [Spirochaetales bacterium]